MQSNQTPRALDIARPLRARNIQVAIGGFHMSGVISMINGDDDALREAQAMGISIYAGEAEERLDEVLRDAYAQQLKPLYNFMNDLPAIEGAPYPLLKREHVNRVTGGTTSFDAGRGCPYQCSFCTIINVQGRKSRRRSVWRRCRSSRRKRPIRRCRCVCRRKQARSTGTAVSRTAQKLPGRP